MNDGSDDDQGRAERTLAALRSALAENPRNGPIWLEVAEILAELGRTSEATKACREAVRFLEEKAEK